MTATVTYVYAIARHTPALSQTLTGLTGVAGSPVHAVHTAPAGAVVAVVSPVPEADYDEAALRRHLEDLTWLENLARAHHGVVETLVACTTVLPLRLATVYRDDDRVRTMIDHRHDQFREQLAHLADHCEWGVKLYVDSPTATVTEQPVASGLSPGRDYLRRRRAQRDEQQDAYRAAERTAERVETAARAHAVGRVRHRIQEGELAAGPGVNISNDAYLVPVDHTEQFLADVTRSADGLPGVRVEVTGPWAPYSFAVAPQSEDPGP
ncbi:GvpL/GvpF family gas vesicle protein [Kitasatospora sp. NBC_00374]|uniref:GvpL/GvpF family gas vesicle protein n=1 Tax=Kitasatospora sp. NBC_00374 TaxID=2975964 RepID=UPI0030DE2215